MEVPLKQKENSVASAAQYFAQQKLSEIVRRTGVVFEEVSTSNTF
jgi:hypothetical protein